VDDQIVGERHARELERVARAERLRHDVVGVAGVRDRHDDLLEVADRRVVARIWHVDDRRDDDGVGRATGRERQNKRARHGR